MVGGGQSATPVTVTFLDDHNIDSAAMLDGVELGGLWIDPDTGASWAICDDQYRPPRFCQLQVDLSADQLDVTVASLTAFDTGATPIDEMDAEGIARAADRTLFVSTEGALMQDGPRPTSTEGTAAAYCATTCPAASRAASSSTAPSRCLRPPLACWARRASVCPSCSPSPTRASWCSSARRFESTASTPTPSASSKSTSRALSSARVVLAGRPGGQAPGD